MVRLRGSLASNRGMARTGCDAHLPQEETIMLNLTEAAGAHLANLLGEAEAPEDVAMRIVVQQNRLSLTLDKERPGDDTLAHEGRAVLVLDPGVSELLTERTLDVAETDEGPKLTIH
ncbi:MAG: hypothetical protein ACE5JS_20380 [Nitrospinota bacterium]